MRTRVVPVRQWTAIAGLLSLAIVARSLTFVDGADPRDRVGVITVPCSSTRVEPTTDRTRVKLALSRISGHLVPVETLFALQRSVGITEAFVVPAAPPSITPESTGTAPAPVQPAPTPAPLPAAAGPVQTTEAPGTAARTIDEAMARVARYVVEYGEQMSLVIGVERYSQWFLSSNVARPLTRQLVSEFAFVRVKEDDWLGFRDVFEVDGNRVSDRQDRLAGSDRRSRTQDTDGADRVDHHRRPANEAAPSVDGRLRPVDGPHSQAYREPGQHYRHLQTEWASWHAAARRNARDL
jgi:hypothetical protein